VPVVHVLLAAAADLVRASRELSQSDGADRHLVGSWPGSIHLRKIMMFVSSMPAGEGQRS
jgi:hypothetical protein